MWKATEKYELDERLSHSWAFISVEQEMGPLIG